MHWRIDITTAPFRYTSLHVYLASRLCSLERDRGRPAAGGGYFMELFASRCREYKRRAGLVVRPVTSHAVASLAWSRGRVADVTTGILDKCQYLRCLSDWDWIGTRPSPERCMGRTYLHRNRSCSRLATKKTDCRSSREAKTSTRNHGKQR